MPCLLTHNKCKTIDVYCFKLLCCTTTGNRYRPKKILFWNNYSFHSRFCRSATIGTLWVSCSGLYWLVHTSISGWVSSCGCFVKALAGLMLSPCLQGILESSPAWQDSFKFWKRSMSNVQVLFKSLQCHICSSSIDQEKSHGQSRLKE